MGPWATALKDHAQIRPWIKRLQSSILQCVNLDASNLLEYYDYKYTGCPSLLTFKIGNAPIKITPFIQYAYTNCSTPPK